MRPPTRTTRSTHSFTTIGLSSNKSQPEGRLHKTAHRAIRPCPGPEDGSVFPQNNEGAQVVEYSAHVIPPNGLSIAVPASSDPPSTDISAGTSQAEKKPRHRMTDRQTQMLEALFHQSTHPSRAEKENLASELRMDLKTITIWFQNKRQTIKKQRDSTKVFVPPFDGMNALASASALMTPLRLVNGSHPPALYERSVQADTGSRTISLSIPPNATPLASASSHSTMPQSSPLEPFTMIHYQPRLATSALIPIPIVHPHPIQHYQPPSLQPQSAPLPTHKAVSCVDAHDLWKHLPSSPPEEAYSAHPSPDLHGFQSHNLSNNDATTSSYQRPRTLEWACAHVSKRRRLETRDDVFIDADSDDGLDSDEETEREGKNLVEASPYAEPISSSAVWVTSPSLSLSEIRVPQEYLAAFPPDVVQGAQLLLALKQSLASRP